MTSGWAEDLAQDALVAALEQWPQSGIPDNPGAWLMATAKHRAIDQLRRRQMAERRHDELGRRQEREHATSELDLAAARRRRHRRRHAQPAVRDVPPDALGAGPRGADAAAVRRTEHAGDRPRLPRLRGDGRPARGAGQAHAGRGARPAGGADRRRAGAPAGLGARGHLPHLQRGLLPPPRARTGCARRCARTPCAWDASWPSSCPTEAEIHGLVALMEIQASRSPARVGPGGEPVLLLDQDRSRWDRVLIGRGLRALARAEQLGRARPVLAPGRHRGLPCAGLDGRTDRLGPDRRPLRRAGPAHPVAGGGAQPGGGGLDGLRARRRRSSSSTRSIDDNALSDYHLLPTVRADLLARLGRVEEARAELERAMELTQNESERRLLSQRAATSRRGIPDRRADGAWLRRRHRRREQPDEVRRRLARRPRPGARPRSPRARADGRARRRRPASPCPSRSSRPASRPPAA